MKNGAQLELARFLLCVCVLASLFFSFLILSISSPSSYADFFFFDGEEVSCFFSIVRQNAIAGAGAGSRHPTSMYDTH